VAVSTAEAVVQRAARTAEGAHGRLLRWLAPAHPLYGVRAKWVIFGPALDAIAGSIASSCVGSVALIVRVEVALCGTLSRQASAGLVRGVPLKRVISGPGHVASASVGALSLVLPPGCALAAKPELGLVQRGGRGCGPLLLASAVGERILGPRVGEWGVSRPGLGANFAVVTAEAIRGAAVVSAESELCRLGSVNLTSALGLGVCR